MPRRMLMADVSGGRLRRRPTLGSMDDDVKVALGNRGMTVHGGWSSMRERAERVESPCTYVTE